MHELKIPPVNFVSEGTKNVRKGASATTTYLKAHWVDYLLLFFICFVLGAFDFFVLKKSDKFLDPSYWYHAGCRIFAYVLAAILGIRIGYPKAKLANSDLQIALKKSHRLIVLKEIDGPRFNGFICGINISVKADAWRAQIKHKLTQLNKRIPDYFLLYYKNRSTDYFKRFKGGKAQRQQAKADRYCATRSDLESLLDDKYIENNIDSLNVDYYVIKDTDFNMISDNGLGYKHYKTRARVKRNASKTIASSLLFTILFTLVVGSISLSVDEAILQSTLISIFSITINAILDIGVTLWRFLNGYMDCEKIVREEDLRTCVERNELLVLYKRTLPKEIIDEYNRELEEQKKYDEQLQAEIEAV